MSIQKGVKNAHSRLRANGDNANSQALRTLESTVNGIGGRVGTSESKIASLERTTSDTNQALATAQSQLNARFDGLSVGGRNLLKNSSPNVTNATYGHRFELTVAPNVGDEVVVTIWGDMGADRTGIGVYNTQGFTELFRLVKITDGIYQGKGRWRKPVRNGQELTPNDTHLNVYFYPNTATSSNRIDRIKLEKGNIATDWTPAPEDVNVDLSPYATNSSLNEFKQTQATKDTATAQKLSQLESGLGTKANTTALDSLTTKVNQVDGKITAEAQKISTLQTTVNGQTASIQQHAQSLNGLSAQYTIKVQTGGIVAGIGLASNNGVSDFAVRADKFYIASPQGQKGDTPFTVLTSPQVINGVRVPAGTYIKDAFIANGSITNAKLANASIDNAKIANASIDSVKIQNGAVGSLQLQDGAVTSAKIGHLAVDTLNIANEAVIVPRAFEIANQELLGAYDIELLSFKMPNHYSPILLNFFGYVSTANWESTLYATLQIIVNGTVLKTIRTTAQKGTAEVNLQPIFMPNIIITNQMQETHIKLRAFSTGNTQHNHRNISRFMDFSIVAMVIKR